jgi:hypothetical protein
MTDALKLNLKEAKEKLNQFTNLLTNPDVICLYISPKKFPESADFLNTCWYDENVTPNMFSEALKDGYFEKYLTSHNDLDVFVWTENVATQFVNGVTIPVMVEQYPGLY